MEVLHIHTGAASTVIRTKSSDSGLLEPAILIGD